MSCIQNYLRTNTVRNLTKIDWPRQNVTPPVEYNMALTFLKIVSLNTQVLASVGLDRTGT